MFYASRISTRIAENSLYQITIFNYRSVSMKFDYYYGIEAESFNFIQIPAILFTDPEYKKLSSDSKILYSLMLNRMSLSRKNGWFDNENRVYIIYTLEEMTEAIGCAHTKCINILKELVSLDLIERKRIGLGKPDIIYVKDFLHSLEGASKHDKITDFSKSEVKTSEKMNSGLLKMKTPDFSEAEANKNNINNIYINKIDKSNNSTPLHQLDINTAVVKEDEESNNEIANAKDESEQFRTILEKNINFDKLLRIHAGNKKLLHYIMDQMVALCADTGAKINLSSGRTVDTETVKNRIIQINYDDIETLLQNLPDKSECNIKNPQGYIRTCLFNIIERRDAICSTSQIKGKNGNYTREYDFEELDRIVFGG